MKTNPILRLCAALFLYLFFVPLSATFGIPTDQHRTKEEVTGVFGILVKDAEGKERFVETDIVPLVENQAYGWIIRLGRGFDKVKWREEFTLPAAPKTWGTTETEGTREISTDKKISVTEKETLVREGRIFNFWSVAAGDPIGKYVIRVFIDNSLVATFHFKVVKPPSSK